jgi:hypothetical protein
MEFVAWLTQNWFEALSALFGLAGLWFAGASNLAAARAQRTANLLTLTQSHRDLWTNHAKDPALSRVLDPDADLVAEPITRKEMEFLNLAIQHLSSTFHAMRNDLTIAPEGLRRDVSEFFALPVPNSAWVSLKALHDRDFVHFVETSIG